MGTIRCAGCGKLIEDGSKTIRIAQGKVTDGAFGENREWGNMHESCFERSVDSPAIALAKIRRLAKQTVVITPGKKSRHA